VLEILKEHEPTPLSEELISRMESVISRAEER
jgi:hypothetical protein